MSGSSSLNKFRSGDASLYGLDNIVPSRAPNASSSSSSSSSAAAKLSVKVPLKSSAGGFDPFDDLLSGRSTGGQAANPSGVSLLDLWNNTPRSSSNSATSTPSAAAAASSSGNSSSSKPVEKRKAAAGGPAGGGSAWDPKGDKFKPLLNDVLKADLGNATSRNSGGSAPTANASAQSAAEKDELFKRVQALTAERDGLQSKVVEAESKVRKIHTQKKKADAEVTRLEQEVERLNSRILRSSYEPSSLGVSPMKSTSDEDISKREEEMKARFEADIAQAKKDIEASFKALIDSLKKENDSLRQEIISIQDANANELNDLKTRGLKKLDELEVANREYEIQFEEMKTRMEQLEHEQQAERERPDLKLILCKQRRTLKLRSKR
eukprot:TRINITY_DN8053_c0_g1_i1.p1 TRINITY_DN8053_c0_g1~~TRINITY_DN8053_c0_g1_i1.p1  ORF type:complete len:380 (+),score=117.17 TRINITY_DN8053_c0_g1_i1:38-1177(+)